MGIATSISVFKRYLSEPDQTHSADEEADPAPSVWGDQDQRGREGDGHIQDVGAPHPPGTARQD